MAKKKLPNNSEIPSVPAPARRRNPTPRKKTGTSAGAPAQAAAPIDIARVTGVEPVSSAPDTGGNGKTRRQPTHSEIAEAAYFRHLNRGGQSDEFDDWVEAERELKNRRR